MKTRLFIALVCVATLAFTYGCAQKQSRNTFKSPVTYSTYTTIDTDLDDKDASEGWFIEHKSNSGAQHIVYCKVYKNGPYCFRALIGNVQKQKHASKNNDTHFPKADKTTRNSSRLSPSSQLKKVDKHLKND